MNNSIHPCLWFDGDALEAAQFYCDTFSNATIITNTPLVVQWEIEGLKMMGLNGGAMFQKNPSISMMLVCSPTEIETLYHQLMAGGSALMQLDKYPWAEQYAWVADRFGMSWQLITGDLPESGDKIFPAFLFTGNVFGQAAEAIHFYCSLFPNSKTMQMVYNTDADGQTSNTLMYGDFILDNAPFAAMDGPGDHSFSFNEAVSLVVECSNQQEIDHYWNGLTKDGMESRCGWLKDRFGVSWQIVPKMLGSWMQNPERAKRVSAAFMQMTKLDIATLENA